LVIKVCDGTPYLEMGILLIDDWQILAFVQYFFNAPLAWILQLSAFYLVWGFMLYPC